MSSPSVITLQVSLQLQTALMRAAAASGRSLHQQAEHFLRQGLLSAADECRPSARCPASTFGLTPKQIDLYRYLLEYSAAKPGQSPSYDEMADHLGLSSKSGVCRLIDCLEERGFLRRLRGRARSLELLVRLDQQAAAAEATS